MSTVRTLKLCVLFTGWVSFLGGGCDLSVLSLGLFVCFVVVVGGGATVVFRLDHLQQHREKTMHAVPQHAVTFHFKAEHHP